MIAGGAGFVGTQIASLLLGNGHKVVLFDCWPDLANEADPISALFHDYRLTPIKNEVVLVKGDVRDRSQIETCLSKYKPDHVIYLAAIADARRTANNPAMADPVNFYGILNMLNALRHYPVHRFVLASSSFVYGHFKYQPADEKHPLGPLDSYGNSKYSAEIMTRAFCAELEIEYVIVRPSAVYGFGDSNRRVSRIFMEHALIGRPLVINPSAGKLDFTYVEDIARGFVLALFTGEAAGHTFNITRGEARSLEELAGIIKGQFPDVEIRITDDSENGRPVRGTLDISAARRVLGYNPRYSLEEGIGKYARQMKDHAEWFDGMP